MLRITFVLMAYLLAQSQLARTQDRTLIAEGDYAAKRTDGDKPMTHWTLWHLGTGDYETATTSIQNPSVTQSFRFDAQFLPKGYSFTIGPPPKAATDKYPKLADLYHPMSVSCDYKPNELRCESDLQGHHSVASIPAKSPYVFFPGELYAIDFPWFLTGVVHLLEGSNPRDGLVNVYVLTENKTNLNDIALTADSPIHLVFTGEENVLVMGKTLTVREYEWEGSEMSVLRVTSNGLVALMSGKSNPTVGFGLSNYTEQGPWESPFHPVLHEVPSQESLKTASASGPGTIRVKVSSGVMQGLLSRRVQPTYPESARQGHIQGTVLLSAVIGKDGHVIDLKPISGPAELTPAAVNAVQQWEYRPYLLSGQPTEVETQVRVNFSLSR